MMNVAPAPAGILSTPSIARPCRSGRARDRYPLETGNGSRITCDRAAQPERCLTGSAPMVMYAIDANQVCPEDFPIPGRGILAPGSG